VLSVVEGFNWFNSLELNLFLELNQPKPKICFAPLPSGPREGKNHWFCFELKLTELSLFKEVFCFKSWFKWTLSFKLKAWRWALDSKSVWLLLPILVEFIPNSLEFEGFNSLELNQGLFWEFLLILSVVVFNRFLYFYIEIKAKKLYS
jgi:hypothetical protein